MTISIQRAGPRDFDKARELLASAGLPVADLVPEHLCFVAAEGNALLGVVGREQFGDIGLLRSLVVAQGAQSSGLGSRLVAALEGEARSQGIEELWLLTIDADAYFGRLGYTVRDRDDAPDPIRETAEFSSLCPGSAVLMSKRL